MYPRLLFLLLCLAAACPALSAASSGADARRLNVVVILADDLGYGDLGCYGHPTHRTPHLDRLAREGVRFTDFYVPAPVCTPTRVTLLTGRYPLRSGLTALLWPEDKFGLQPDELTLPELLRQAGYATHLSGKWHLGHTPAHLPRSHGFDHWFGMPYPNDMDGRHPRSIGMKLNWPPLPLMRDDVVVEQPADIDLLTEKYTADAEAFIAAQGSRPFFLFLSHAMPHTWLGASKPFRGQSRNGLFGDAVEELDASIGRIRAALERAGVAQRTVIFFSNDNGAVLPPDPANAKAVADARIMFPDATYGTNAPLRGGKQDVLEGGVRVPAIVWLPGGARGVVHRGPAAIQDVLPTVLELAGVPLPADRVLDGRSLARVLRGTGEREPTDFFFGSATLLAVRSGGWKLVERRSMRATDARLPPVDELYRVDTDPGETRNLAGEHPERVRELKARLAAKRQELEAEAVRRGYREAALTSAPSFSPFMQAAPRSNFRSRLGCVLAALCALSLQVATAFAADKPVAANTTSPKRLNVLWIIADDLNVRIGAMGDRQARTPNIDRLAQRGTLFRQAYATWTSCLPSRSSFLSGWQPTRAAITDWSSHHSRRGALAEAIYAPEHFKARGYFTARLDKVFHIGKDDARSWHVTEEPWRDAQGVFRPVTTAKEVPSLGLESRVLAQGNFPQVSGETGSFAVLDVDDDALFDGRNARRAIELLQARAGAAEPFFLAVGFRRPHLPWLAPKRYFDLYPPESIELPPRAADGNRAPADESVHRQMLAHYYASLAYVDAMIGRVLGELDRLGLADNTLVVLHGDHGYLLGERGDRFGKGNLWERSLHTPLIFAGPGVARGNALSDVVSLLDLYPTFVDVSGVPAPATPLDGRSLRRLLADGRDPAWRGYAVSFTPQRDQPNFGASVRNARYRYSENAELEPVELVDLQVDPYERRNLVNRPEVAAVQSDLRKILVAERAVGRSEK